MRPLRLSQYAFLAAASFARYSGVSKAARLAAYSGDAIVALKRSLRWVRATGSDIFSRRLPCAARMPSIRLASNSGSLPLRSPQDFISGLASKFSRKMLLVDLEHHLAFLGHPRHTPVGAVAAAM